MKPKVYVYILLAEILLVLIGLLLIPGDEAPLNFLGLSYRRLILVITLAIIATASLGALKILRDEKTLSQWVSQNPLIVERLSLGFVLLLSGAFFFFLAWLLGDATRYPLFLRATSVVLPLVTGCLFGLHLIFKTLDKGPKETLLKELKSSLLLIAFVLAISALTVYIQVNWKAQQTIFARTVELHEFVLQGVAGNPWQYRIFPEYLAEGFSVLFQELGISNPLITSFLFWRIAQTALVLFLAMAYYQKLGLGRFAAYCGLALIGLAWLQSFPDNNLHLNSDFNVLFFLLAALAILYKTPRWVIPITFVAAFNRETSGLIPVMLLADFLSYPPPYNKEALSAAIASLAAYTIAFASVRYAFPTQGLLIPYGQTPGIELFLFNIRPASLVAIYSTFGAIFLIAPFAFKQLPRPLKAFALPLVPIWIVVHLFLSVISETRLLMEPFVLIIIPAVLLGITQSKPATSKSTPR